MSTDAPAEVPKSESSGEPPKGGAADSSSTSKPAPAPHEGGVKETIESILIAFILAFIFRAFVVEAFVIPTGSMAPTLMGAHMRFTCTDCAYKFDANFSSLRTGAGGASTGGDLVIPATAVVTFSDGRQQPITYGAHCPNCGLKVPQFLRPNADEGTQQGDPDNDATAPPVHYGDRILVLKYVYELSPPRRWDVVVFKSPDPVENEPAYTVNFIKRLIGTPGETVMILDGDIYVRAPGSDEFVVQTKPRVAQERLWRIVHDNDFLPRREGWEQPSRADTVGGWSVGSAAAPARDFAFSLSDAQTSWLRFEPDESQANQPLTDWLAYADTRGQGEHANFLNHFDNGGLRAENNVSDLKLACSYQRQSGAGPLRLELSKRDDTFTAEVHPDHVRLLHRVGADADEELGRASLDGSANAPMRVEFANVDYRVSLRIDGREYLRTTPQQYAPDIGLLRRAYDRGDDLPRGRARIGAEGQTCRLSHVSLWRDIYYTNRGSQIWTGTPANPITLGAKEYWVLGDNSLMSGDARVWQSPINLPHEDLSVGSARVPERFLLGKAFFVYWPAGYRPISGGPGFVPNFGGMRFIH